VDDGGDVIERTYEVRRDLEVGSRSTLLEATERDTERFVLIELFRPFRSTEDRERFLRDQRLVAELQSPHVAHVFGSGVRGDGTTYVVSEVIEGESLETLLRRHGPLPLGRVVELMLQLCGVLEEAHAANLVHGAIGPENLFVTYHPDGSSFLKLREFGACSAIPAQVEGQRPSAPPGVAPEQLSGAAPVDPRTDIWALGATMYELSCGRHPTRGASAEAPIVSLSQLRPGLPVAFGEAVMCCLSTVPMDRYPSAVEAAEAIARFGPSRGHGVASAVRGVLAAGATRLRSSTEIVRQMVRQRKT
jgi:serine/threonine-protein kinase